MKGHPLLIVERQLLPKQHSPFRGKSDNFIILYAFGFRIVRQDCLLTMDGSGNTNRKLRRTRN